MSTATMDAPSDTRSDQAREYKSPTQNDMPIKFIVSSSVLLRHVKALLSVVSSNPIVPVLEGILFEIGPEQSLTLTASTLQTTLLCSVPIQVSSRESDGITGFSVDAKRLYKLLSRLPEQPITITLNGAKKVTIDADSGSYNFCPERRLDWPKLPTITNPETSRIYGKNLASALIQTLPFTSRDDLRPAMTGVYFHGNKLAATDGHRLIRIELEELVSAQKFILPAHVGRVFLKAYGKLDSIVTIEASSANVRLTWANYVLMGRVIDERFPDYENAIPTNNPIEVIANRQALIRLISRVSVFANPTTHQIKLFVESDRIRLVANNNDYQESCSEWLSADVSGDTIKIGFNASLLLETLKSISGTHVQIEMSNPNRAALLRSHDGEPDQKRTFLNMPVMLNEYGDDDE